MNYFQKISAEFALSSHCSSSFSSPLCVGDSGNLFHHRSVFRAPTSHVAVAWDMRTSLGQLHPGKRSICCSVIFRRSRVEEMKSERPGSRGDGSGLARGLGVSVGLGPGSGPCVYLVWASKISAVGLDPEESLFYLII